MRLSALLAALLLALPAHAATERTGERFDGGEVIERLDVADLPAGTHRFWFRGGANALAQGWWVPVVVVKGARPGPRLLLTAGMHGDELNGIAVIHQLIRETDAQQLSGTLVLVPGANPPALLRQTRNWTTTREGEGANLNRLMPGDAAGDTPERHAERLWTRVMRPNADTAIDLHTQSRGVEYPMYVFSDPRNPRNRRIAELLGPDMVKVDKGQKGTVETTFNDAGVPAVTLELGPPLVFEAAMVRRGVDGVRNLMRDLRMLPGAPTRPRPAFVGNATTTVATQRGGWATLEIALGDRVRAGQAVGFVADAFGRVTERLTAPVEGRVLVVATDPMREPGDRLVTILSQNDEPRCADGSC